jgi:hypothetical protein
MKTLFLLISWTLLPLVAIAQEPISPPAGFKVPNPANAHWIVAHVGPLPPPPPGAAAAPLSLPAMPTGFYDATEDTTRYGDTTYIVRRHAGGGDQTWHVGRVQITLRDGWDIPVSITAPTDGSRSAVQYTTVNKAMFPELGWVSTANFVNAVPVSGRMCFVFARGDEKAYFDVNTLQPIMLAKPDETLLYKILPPPAGPIKLPPAVDRLAHAPQPPKADPTKLPPP